MGLAFSPDGSLIASANRDRTLKVFDAIDGDVRFTIGPREGVFRKAIFSPDGRWIAAGVEWDKESPMESPMLIDVTTGNVAARFSEEGGNMHPTFDHSGNRIATAHVDGSIRLWSWNGIDLHELTSWKAAEQTINSLSFSADGSKLFSSETFRNKNTVWNTATGKPLATFRSQDHVYWSEFSPDGNGVALYSTSDGIRIWRFGERRAGRV